MSACLKNEKRLKTQKKFCLTPFHCCDDESIIIELFSLLSDPLDICAMPFILNLAI